MLERVDSPDQSFKQRDTAEFNPGLLNRQTFRNSVDKEHADPGIDDSNTEFAARMSGVSHSDNIEIDFAKIVRQAK